MFAIDAALTLKKLTVTKSFTRDDEKLVEVDLQLAMALQDDDLARLPHGSEVVAAALKESRAIGGDDRNTSTHSYKRTQSPWLYALGDENGPTFTGEARLQPKYRVVQGAVEFAWTVRTDIHAATVARLADLVGVKDTAVSITPGSGSQVELAAVPPKKRAAS